MSQADLPDPTVTAYATAHDSNYLPGEVFEKNLATAYASSGLGGDITLAFNFAAATIINGFDMTPRNDVAHGLPSTLIFDDNADFSCLKKTILLTHADHTGACNQYSFANISAQYVRWNVVAINSANFRAKGAAEMTFYGPATSAVPVPGPASFLLAPAFAATATRLRRLRRRSRQWTSSNMVLS
jgi:hypothetical protein